MNILTVVALLLITDVPSSPTLGSHTFDLTASDFVTHSSTIEGYGPYYVMQLDLPPEIETVQQAWLEVYMDVSAREVEGWLDPAPLLEAYELETVLTGDPTPSDFVPAEVPITRIVSAGENRRIRLDITQIVRNTLESPAGNHGIVLGSLTNERFGVFDLKTGVFGATIVARVIIME